MPARTPKAAVDAFVDRLRRSAACITDRPLRGSGYRPLGAPYQLTFAPLRDPVSLRARHGPFEVRTTAYRYHLLDHQRREPLAYHWHPIGVSPVTSPHLHLSSRIAAIELGPDIDPVVPAEMHLPTGFVTFEDIIWLLIAEFGVEPRRADWQAILRESQASI